MRPPTRPSRFTRTVTSPAASLARECVLIGHQAEISSVNSRNASIGLRRTSTDFTKGASSTTLIVFLRISLEAIECLAPETVEPVAQGAQSGRVDAVDARRATRFVAH